MFTFNTSVCSYSLQTCVGPGCFCCCSDFLQAPAAQHAGADLDALKHKVTQKVLKEFIAGRCCDGSAAYDARHPEPVPNQGVGAVAGPPADTAAAEASSGIAQAAAAVAEASREAAATAAETGETAAAAPVAEITSHALVLGCFNQQLFLAQVIGMRSLAVMVASSVLLTLPTVLPKRE